MNPAPSAPTHSKAWLLPAVLLLDAACLPAPTVVVRDRKTALEEQAAGRYRALENDLRQAALSPKGEDLTRGQIVKAGQDTSGQVLDVVVRIYGSVREDAERLDDLLRRHCVGEGRDGLLLETVDACAGERDPTAAAELVQRTNRDRRQLWRHIAGRRSGASEEEVRSVWRQLHLRALACGGWVQGEDGSWSAKEC